MLIEIQKVKAILMRFKMKKRTTLGIGQPHFLGDRKFGYNSTYNLKIPGKFIQNVNK